jgi:hypothetical protein
VDVVGEVAELDPQVRVALVELEILAEAGLNGLRENKNKNCFLPIWIRVLTQALHMMDFL